MPVPELALQAHFPKSKWDRSHHGYISGVYYEFQITSFNGKSMMGPKDLYIYTTGMAGGPNANVELLLALAYQEMRYYKYYSTRLYSMATQQIIW